MFGSNSFALLIFMGMCASAWVTQVLGLHCFFGGFIFGVCVPKDDKEFIHKFIGQLEVVVVNFFVPLFFANSGLTTDLAALRANPGAVLLVITLAAAGKLVPTFFISRLRGYSWRFSFQLASLMNARGLVELIALSIAQSSGVFNVQMYSIFIVMALVTTFVAGPMFYFSYRKDLDPPAEPSKSSSKSKDKEQKGQEGPEVDTHEVPFQNRLVPPLETYGYLVHGTIPIKDDTANQRKRLSEVFGLNQPDGEMTVALNTDVELAPPPAVHTPRAHAPSNSISAAPAGHVAVDVPVVSPPMSSVDIPFHPETVV